MKTKTKTINYIALFEQLNQFLPMLRRQALQAVEYGDMNTGRIHHRIQYVFALGQHQWVLSQVDALGATRRLHFFGDCKIEQVLEEAQKWIQLAHQQEKQWFAWFRRRKPEPKMQYFAY